MLVVGPLLSVKHVWCPCRPPKPTHKTSDEYHLDDAVRRWAKPEKLQPYLQQPDGTLFDFGLLMVPIEFAGHWMLLVAEMRAGAIHVYDSAVSIRHMPLTRLLSPIPCRLHRWPGDYDEVIWSEFVGTTPKTCCTASG
jgi:hypothetical protein